MQYIKINKPIRMKRTILILLIFSTLFVRTSKGTNVCTIKGKVIGLNCKTLLLFKSNQDFSYLSEKILIDENNSFEHSITNPTGERYSLMVEEELNKGTGYRINFFTDSKSIEFKIYPIDQMTKNEINGSNLSSKFLQFEIEEKKWLDLNQNKNALNQDSIFKVLIFNKLKYIKGNQNIIGYSILIDLIQAVDFIPILDKEELKKIGISFQEKFPDHPYSEIIKVFNSLKVGGYYANFKAPNTEGNLIEISDVIKANKITLIDLWAPWCGPCVEKGRDLIPLYHKYKAAKFEIIGVVGGIKDAQSYIKAVEKEKYPWQNLSEISNKEKIWEKYNIMNAGGRMFLIDNKGIILAIDPSVVEIEKLLKGKL